MLLVPQRPRPCAAVSACRACSPPSGVVFACSPLRDRCAGEIGGDLLHLEEDDQPVAQPRNTAQVAAASDKFALRSAVDVLTGDRHHLGDRIDNEAHGCSVEVPHNDARVPRRLARLDPKSLRRSTIGTDLSARVDHAFDHAGVSGRLAARSRRGISRTAVMRNLAVELLQKLLKGKLATRRRKNVVQDRSFAALR